MKKRFLSVLLTLGMVLMMLPTTAYADSTWCDTCNKRVTVRYEYEYKDAQWHWNHTYCLECGKNTSNPRAKHQSALMSARMTAATPTPSQSLLQDTTTKAL